jgi:hypothetical protein
VARLTLLVAELDRLPKPYLLKIYSPVGQSTDEGHNLLSLAIPQREPDAFKFLDDFLRRCPPGWDAVLFCNRCRVLRVVVPPLCFLLTVEIWDSARQRSDRNAVLLIEFFESFFLGFAEVAACFKHGTNRYHSSQNAGATFAGIGLAYPALKCVARASPRELFASNTCGSAQAAVRSNAQSGTSRFASFFLAQCAQSHSIEAHKA